MTSRRSRLKAVANLPVRRKVPALTVNDVVSSNNSTSEKVTSSSSKGDEVSFSNFNTCQNEGNEKITFLENIQTINGGNKEDIIKCSSDLLNHEYPFIKNIVNKLSEVNNSDTLGNNNEVNRTINVNKTNFNNSPTLTSSSKFKPNLVSSLVREEGQSKSSDKNLESQNLEKQNFSIYDSNSSEICNNNNKSSNNIEKETGNCYTILTTQNEDESSLSTYTITPLAPCKTDVTTYSNTYTQPENEEYEEVQIYTELGEATDLYVNLPKFVNNTSENTKFVLEPEQTEPILTTLLRGCGNKDLKIINRNTESNPSKSKSMSPSLFAKPYEKNLNVNSKNKIIGNEMPHRNPVAMIRDKLVLGNSNLKISQNIVSDSDSLNLSFKRNVSTLRRKRSKCSDFTKKLADARREFQKKYEKSKPDRSSLKMIDLIFYNPSTNPMVSKSKFEKKEISLGQGELIQELLSEEKIDEPEPMDCDLDSHSTDNNEMENSKMPVPQVKIGLNGEIILDERSLIIETTDAKKGREDLQNSIPVFEDKGSKVSYYRGKTRKTRDWTDFETKRFYKALNTIGPDFSLMQKYFPKRSRLELKNKFKREERLNRNLIDKALNNPSEFDMTLLEKDLAVERKAEEEEVEMKLCKAVREKHLRKRSKSKSFLSREMVEFEEESDEESENNRLKLAAINSKRLSQSEKNKKKKEINFIFQKILLKDSEKQINELAELSAPSSCIVQSSDSGVT